MTTENYDIVINERGGKTVKRTLDDIADSVKRAADSLGGMGLQGDNFVASLKRQAETLGFTRAQLLSYDAAQLKLNASQRESVNASIRQIDAFDKARSAAKSNIDVIGTLKTQIIGIAAAYVSFQGVIGGGRAILDASIANERFTNSLILGTGSVQAATKEIAFLREESDRLGLQFSSTAEQYAKLTAASKGTQLEGQATRDIFIGVAQAATVLGLSADNTGGVLTAVQQIISKNKVSTEELLQIAERVPGTFNTVSRALGVTGQELSSMLQKGELLASDLLPKLAAEWQRTFGPQSSEAAKGLNAQVNRMDNSLFDLKLSIGRLGLIDVFSSGIDFVTKFVSVIDRSTDAMGRLVAKTKQLPFIGGAIDSFLDFLPTGPKALSGLVDYLDKEVLPKTAPIDTTLIAPEKIKSIVTPTSKPELPREVLQQLKAEAKERERLSIQRQNDAKREVDSAQKVIDSLKLESKEIGLNAIQRKMLAAANAASKAPNEKLRLEIMASANAYALLSQKQETALALEKDLQRVKSLTESVASPQERLAATTQELDRLRQAGLSQETYNRVLAKTNDELFKVKETGRDVFGSLDQFAIQGARNIQTSLANFLFNPFDDGLEGMVRGVADAVRRMIAEFAAFKILQSSGISSLFNSGFGGGASSSGNSAANFLNIASLGNSLKSGLRSGFGIPSLVGRGLSMLPGSVGAFGAGLAGTGAGVFSAAGGAGTAFIGGAGTAIGGSGMGVAAGLGSSVAAAAGPLAVAAIADVVFRMLAGNKSTGSKIIDSIPVIGSLGALLFGHGPLKFRQEALIGKASGEGFDGRVTDVFRAKGGLFVGNKHREQASPNEAAFLDLFDNTLKGFGTSVKGFADNLGLSTDSVTNFSKEIDLRSEKGKRLTEEAVQELLDNLGNEIAGGVLAQIDVIAKSGETNIQTLSRLSAEFDVLNTAALSTGRSLKEARDAILSLPATFRTEVVDQLGGVDAASQKIGFFIDNFLSDTEKLKPMFESLDQQMQKLGFSASITRDDFTNLIKSVGSAGGITKDQYIGLLGLIEQFDQVDKLRDKLSQSTNSLVERERNLLDIRNELTSTYQKERSELEGTISKFKDLAGQLRDFRQSLLLGELSPLTPRQKLDEARQQFNEVRLKAATGDQNALAKLPNVAQEFLKASQTYNASSAAFVSDFNLVQSVLKNAEGVALSQVDITTQQLKALDDSVGNLVDINQNTKTTADLVKELVATSLKGAGNPSISTQTIKDYLAANPGLTPQQVGTKAAEFGVSSGQLSAAGYDISKLNQSLGGASVTDKQIIDFVNANRNNPMAIYNAARANGISSRRLSSVSGISLTDIEKFVRNNGLQSFARGTDFISRSGLAMVHRAEAIVPSSTTEEIKRLNDKIERLLAEQNTQTGDLIAATDITSKQNAKAIAEALVEVENSRQWSERRMPNVA